MAYFKEIPPDVPSFVNKTYGEFMQWCRDVREGRIKTSRKARDYAKAMTFHEYYGTGIQRMKAKP